MKKNKMRQLMIEKLNKLAVDGRRQEQVESIYRKFFQSDLWLSATSIGVTIATDFEFPTAPLIQRALLEGKKVAVPKSLPKRQLIFYWIDKTTTFELSKFGVEEPISDEQANPDELDLVVVPGLIFKENGYRIGFGGGFYDRFLANYSGRTASFVFVEQLMESWEEEPFDLPVQQLFIGEMEEQ
ncbi:5-formyltetrahydrofolate cyclo-ligase [Enterococcus pallens]|uniref:5-formyltetrahydrofolate cyclo-ligase n=1 Tax=Enterococcus pallens ATCC BAA-351 TaxID=1158607 RepID=R2SHP6_9ENTE|nr:5-formyltetrahydrofolate cyclo-ligase [Enterococcus pallens]EOH87709.1 5-formyltetrahydrofolate cyclo-ligase [Enterococcus pallens ATCC BAA-351]EOU17923.1 5-formyltetrahydrofolate cyclo-ligase [Enterococcus pallens ATCC BAA-351]OJG82454.1 5-formyltetrahydrofolate cyclo-ligase [Enterococcus pallens]